MGEINFNGLKNSLQDNQIFKISAGHFSESKREEPFSLTCFYSPKYDSLCVVIDNSTKYLYLSRELLMNLLEFAKKMMVTNIFLLLDRKNRDYIKILQSMMTIGFVNDSVIKTAKVQEKDYKMLKLEIKNDNNVIEEIAF